MALRPWACWLPCLGAHTLPLGGGQVPGPAHSSGCSRREPPRKGRALQLPSPGPPSGLRAASVRTCLPMGLSAPDVPRSLCFLASAGQSVPTAASLAWGRCPALRARPAVRLALKSESQVREQDRIEGRLSFCLSGSLVSGSLCGRGSLSGPTPALSPLGPKGRGQSAAGQLLSAVCGPGRLPAALHVLWCSENMILIPQIVSCDHTSAMAPECAVM